MAESKLACDCFEELIVEAVRLLRGSDKTKEEIAYFLCSRMTRPLGRYMPCLERKSPDRAVQE